MNAAVAAAVSLQVSGHTALVPTFFSPAIGLSADDLDRIRSGRVLTETLDSSGHDLGVLAIGALRTTPDAFIARVTDIVQLRRSRLVPVVARFSNPPVLADLEALTLDDQDLADLARCRPGDCGVKLGDAEIHRVRERLSSGGSERRAVAEQTFREIVLERVQTYLAGGLEALPAYHDKRQPVAAADAFNRLLDQSEHLNRVPLLKASVGRPPADGITGSYIYWSIEDFGRRPVIRVTHVVMIRPTAADLPEVLVGSTQVYASHYTDATLAVTALERGPADARYLSYLHRARVDVLGNFFVRRIVEGRIEDEIERLFLHQIERLQDEG